MFLIFDARFFFFCISGHVKGIKLVPLVTLYELHIILSHILSQGKVTSFCCPYDSKIDCTTREGFPRSFGMIFSTYFDTGRIKIIA